MVYNYGIVRDRKRLRTGVVAFTFTARSEGRHNNNMAFKCCQLRIQTCVHSFLLSWDQRIFIKQDTSKVWLVHVWKNKKN